MLPPRCEQEEHDSPETGEKPEEHPDIFAVAALPGKHAAENGIEHVHETQCRPKRALLEGGGEKVKAAYVANGGFERWHNSSARSHPTFFRGVLQSVVVAEPPLRLGRARRTPWLTTAHTARYAAAHVHEDTKRSEECFGLAPCPR